MPIASNCNLMKQLKLNTLVVRKQVSIDKMPELIAKSYEAIFKYLAEINEYICAAPFVIYHNMDMQNMDVEIGLAVSKKLDPKGEIMPGIIEEGLVASIIHLGTYRELEPTYDTLSKWINDNKLKAKGISIEWYYNDWNTIPEDRLITNITMPVVPA